MKCSHNPALDDVPEAHNGVRVNRPVNVFTARMGNEAMLRVFSHVVVPVPFVSTDHAYFMRKGLPYKLVGVI